MALVPTDLSKLSNVIKNDIARKTIYDELLEKVNTIDTSKLVNKTGYNAAALNDGKEKILDNSAVVINRFVWCSFYK